MAQITIQQAFDLAAQHHQAGRLQEAERLYRQILAQQPEHFFALHHLGLLAHEVGQNDVAVELIRRAIAVKPGYAEAHSNLGNALIAAGRLDEAVAACRAAIALQSTLADAYSNLGIALRGLGQVDEAIASCRRAIALRPEYAEAYSNLGNALADRGQRDEAIAAYREAIAINSNLAEIHNNLGNALRDQGQLDEAIASFNRAIAINPNLADVHDNVGGALRDQGQLDNAIAAFRRAIALNPEHAEAHNNLGMALLAREEFQQGWEEYEWRWKCKGFPAPVRNFARPMWDGSPLEGRTILLHTEQGLGDAIQFVRYVPLVAQRGGRIIVECQAELEGLFQTVSEGCQIVAYGRPLPAFDFHSPLLSLPRIFGTTLGNIPKSVPYLSASAARIDVWSRTLGAADGRLRISLAWAGNPRFKADRTRSLNLQQLAPFAAVRGVKFYSLQKGPAAEQAENPPAGLELFDLGPKLSDFADTAAVITLMDLIITTDTSVPHLAGALGKPVWLMLQHVPDFRWLLNREESPWYPSMRLFRQAHRGDWDGVITQVIGALSDWIKNHR